MTTTAPDGWRMRLRQEPAVATRSGAALTRRSAMGVAVGSLACLASASDGMAAPGLVVAPSKGSAKPLSPATLGKIDAIAASWVERGKSPGLAVGVARGGKGLFSRGCGYADLEQKTAVTEKTVFRVGSLQKQFTAVAVLMLAEQGHLSLEDRLSKYFPDLGGGDTATIRQLLRSEEH